MGSSRIAQKGGDDAFCPQNDRPVDHFAVERERGAVALRSLGQHAPGPGQFLCARTEAAMHVRDLVRVDAEFSSETELAGMLRILDQLARIVDRGADAIDRGGDAGDALRPSGSSCPERRTSRRSPASAEPSGGSRTICA